MAVVAPRVQTMNDFLTGYAIIDCMLLVSAGLLQAFLYKHLHFTSKCNQNK